MNISGTGPTVEGLHEMEFDQKTVNNILNDRWGGLQRAKRKTGEENHEERGKQLPGWPANHYHSAPSYCRDRDRRWHPMPATVGVRPPTPTLA
jgi:hypothetical protein